MKDPKVRYIYHWPHVSYSHMIDSGFFIFMIIWHFEALKLFIRPTNIYSIFQFLVVPTIHKIKLHIWYMYKLRRIEKYDFHCCTPYVNSFFPNHTQDKVACFKKLARGILKVRFNYNKYPGQSVPRNLIKLNKFYLLLSLYLSVKRSHHIRREGL
jgi:hypothetical protein